MVDIFSRGVGIFWEGLRFSSIVWGWFSDGINNFCGEGEGGKNFSGGLRFFREGFKLFLEGWNWDFLMGGVLEVTSRDLKNFQGGLLKDFWRNWELFKCMGLRFFHDCWDFSGLLKITFFLLIEIFWEGKCWYFSRGLRFFQGIKIIPSEMSFLSGCLRFSMRCEVKFFFWRRFNFFFGGGREYILKLAFSHDKVLPCILQDAPIWSLKYYSRNTPYL